MSRLPALLVGVLLAVGVGTACEATGGSAGCRAAAAAPSLELAPKPKKTATRKPICTKANKTNGEQGSKRRYYRWDFTHNDIEVFNGSGQHLGTMDPSNGKMTKPAVPGRRIDT